MLVLAHRGYSGKFPENTLRAFREALQLKAPGIELDVHLSRDQELVVTHDITLGRCVKSGTPGETRCVADFSAAELGKMDAGSFKGAEFAGEIVSPLGDVVKLINHQCLLNVEIKQETLRDQKAYETMTEKLLAQFKDYGLKDVIFSSFDAHALKTLRRKSNDARVAYLDDCAHQGPRISEAQQVRAEFYNVNLKRVTFEQVAQLHQAAFKVAAYTAKSIDDLKLAEALKIDAVFADNLEEALKHFPS